jgi:hypothetical protein
MARKKRADAIYLSKPGLIILFAVLGIVALSLILRLIIPKNEAAEEQITLDIESERQPGAIVWQLISQTPTPHGSDSGALWEILVPCDIARAPLIATTREALIEMYLSHPNHICHQVNIFLQGLAPPNFSPVLKAQLCKKGRIEDNERIAPWAFHIRLIPETRWDEWGFDAGKIQSICVELAKAQYCPWDSAEHNAEEIQHVAGKLGVTPENAAKLIRDGQNLVSDNYNYRRALK